VKQTHDPGSAQSPQGEARPERAALKAVADFLGGLLVKEVDAPQLARLREPTLRTALTEFGIELPSQEEQRDWIEARGADYHDLFLRPETGPLVQSLWAQGRYEGDAAVRVRQLAEAAGVQFQRGAARGAAVDHLGSLLLLWSATEGKAQPIADEIARDHLDWATPGLRRVEASGGFYGAVASATLALVGALT
jgi:TorA maturation chaperone TorD